MEHVAENQPVTTRSFFWGFSEKRQKYKANQLGIRIKMLQYSKKIPVKRFLVAVP